MYQLTFQYYDKGIDQVELFSSFKNAMVASNLLSSVAKVNNWTRFERSLKEFSHMDYYINSFKEGCITVELYKA